MSLPRFVHAQAASYYLNSSEPTSFLSRLRTSLILMMRLRTTSSTDTHPSASLHR